MDHSEWPWMHATLTKPLYQLISQYHDMSISNLNWLVVYTLLSKMDFKSAFWQIELEDSSRYVTVFHANDKPYRYKHLTMGIKPVQGELIVALESIFMHIDNIHLIHDDLIIATRTMSEHIAAIHEVMEAISNAGLTLNTEKCKFGSKEVKFWGTIFSADGMQPDPDKIDRLNFIKAPTDKDDLIRFFCMMQSNSIVCTFPFCWGGGRVEPPTKFSKRGGLIGPQLLQGVAGKEGVTIFGEGGGGLQFSHKKNN